MKMMKNFYLLFIGSFLLTFSSCESYVEGLNVDPNNFTDAPGELIIGQAQLSWVLLAEGEAARMSGIFTDQFTGFSNQYINFEEYNVTASDFDGMWSNGYSAGLAQTRIVQSKAIASNNTVLLGVSQIVEGVLTAELAALFGDVPLSESISPEEFPNPRYDTQQEVLAAAQDLLSQGIENVGSARVRDFFGTPIFVSNNALWSEVGHSLKARYFLLTQDYQSARDEALLGISSTDRGLLSFHSDTDGQRNLFYQFGVEQRGGYLTVTRSHLRKLINLNDGSVDRLLFTPGEQERTGSYFSGNELNYGENGYFSREASFPIIDWYETQFILAESEVRLGNDDDARQVFNAVRRQLAVDYGGSFPEVAVSGVTLYRVIMEEKYITLVGSIQVFHDLRRTNNVVGVPIKNPQTETLPQRFLYPETERNTNANFPGVVGLYEPTAVNR